MICDDWDGFGVYASDDGLNYSKQGERRDDCYFGRHCGVAVLGKRAFIFCFVNPEQATAKPENEKLDTHSHAYKRSVLQIAELEIVDGNLVCDRDKYARGR